MVSSAEDRRPAPPAEASDPVISAGIAATFLRGKPRTAAGIPLETAATVLAAH